MKAQKYETIAVGIVQFYHLLAYEQTTIDTQTSVNTYLKNLVYYVHQCFLAIAQITLSRILGESGKASKWALRLKEQVSQKAQRKLKTHSETCALLKVYCSNMENIIRNIAQANQSKKLFEVIGDWMNQIQKVPVERIRDVLYNIEQFKSDAFKLPEIRAKSQDN